MQKAPEEMSPILVQKRFEAWLASAPPEAKLVRLIVLSSYLEKVQKLTSGELERLLAAGENVPKTGS